MKVFLSIGLFLLLCVGSTVMIAFGLTSRSQVLSEQRRVQQHQIPLSGFAENVQHMQRWLLILTTERTQPHKDLALAKASHHERLASKYIRGLIFDHEQSVEHHNALVHAEQSMADCFLLGRKIAEGDRTPQLLDEFRLKADDLSEQVRSLVALTSTKSQEDLSQVIDNLQLLIVVAIIGLIGFMLVGLLAWFSFSAYSLRLRAEVQERQKAEEELRRMVDELECQAKLAQQASRSKSLFLANMSHETRTPMNGILGMAELLLGTDLSDQQRDWAQTIITSVRHQLSVVDDILEFSRLESLNIQPEQERFDLPLLTFECIDLLRDRVDDRVVRLMVDVEPDLPQWWIGDAGRIRQILLNLIGNALKFTSQGYVLVQLKLHQDGIEWAVQDTGIGIEPDRMHIIFDSFEQANLEVSRRFGGTGLGLSISQRLAGIMDGGIRCESEFGKGSQFTLSLPLQQHPDQEDSNEIFREPISLLGKSLLIADPSFESLRIHSRLAEHIGLKVYRAQFHQEVLSILARESVDFMLVHRCLKDQDVKTSANSIRKAYPHIPIIYAANSSRNLDESRLEEEGFQGVMLEPCPESLFARICQKVLSDSAQIVTAHTPETGVFKRQRPADEILSGVHCLIVEDNPTNQRVMHMLLERHGAKITLANDGQVGVECFVRDRPDVILMDKQMPRMDGIEATREIRRLEREESSQNYESIPIIAVTANTMDSDREDCLAAGMDAFVAKPVRIKDLMSIIRSLLPST